jgi:hypothetical protein
MKTWNVRVHRASGAVHLGQVSADAEDSARCTALSRWGVTDDDLQAGEADAVQAILPLDDFDVSPA